MRKLFCLVLLVVLLTGCPGKDGLKMSRQRSVFLDGQHICFSTDKQAVLTRYILTTNGDNYKELLHGDVVKLSYPDTCFIAHLEKGVTYNVAYALDGVNYYYTFVINNENNILVPGR